MPGRIERILEIAPSTRTGTATSLTATLADAAVRPMLGFRDHVSAASHSQVSPDISNLLGTTQAPPSLPLSHEPSPALRIG